MLARVAGEEAQLFQLCAELGVELNEGAGDSQPDGSGLTCEATSVGEHHDIELVSSLGSEQRLADRSAGRLRREIFIERLAIDSNGALTGPEEDPSDGRLPAAGSEMLN